ncbi:MAG: FAD:protein FMN transferase [Nocardioidaceae bacterium]
MTAVARPDRPPSTVELVETMGTVVTLDVRTRRDPAALAAAFADAAARLQEADGVFSTWLHDSWASRLVRREVVVDDCPPPVPGVLRLAELLERVTDGWFSPAWRGPETGPDAVGLVKGWAAQRASDALVEHGFPDHVVNAAGDLLVAGSPAPDGPGEDRPWRIGISYPGQPGSLLGAVTLPAGPHRWAVATSGPGEQGLHVVDPRTGDRPADVVSATAVTSVDAPHPEAGAWADGCATALVAAGPRADQVLTSLAPYGVRGAVLHADGRLVDPDGLLLDLGHGA